VRVEKGDLRPRIQIDVATGRIETDRGNSVGDGIGLRNNGIKRSPSTSENRLHVSEFGYLGTRGHVIAIGCKLRREDRLTDRITPLEPPPKRLQRKLRLAPRSRPEQTQAASPPLVSGDTGKRAKVCFAHEIFVRSRAHGDRFSMTILAVIRGIMGWVGCG
jgi:hypothetical protein